MDETDFHKTDFRGPIDGPVHAGSGNIIIYTMGEAYNKLRTLVPEGDEALQALVQSLRGFAAYHEVIGEWKELHSLLQELLNDLNQFVMEVDRLYNEGEVTTREHLRRRWRPCERRIRRLIDFAKGVSHISGEPFHEEDGELGGPTWAVEIFRGQRRIREALDEAGIEIEDLYEWASELSDTCDSHLYRADRNLHNQAGELSNLSRGILARIGQ